ncbi:MAG: uncharacterized protein QOH74_1198, partial [Gaiellales bacterium]|nr:uncharacterized protein [Gaiellales bacterium]
GPNATVTSAPTDPTTNPSPQFEFGPQGAGAAFECSLSVNTDLFAPCTSPMAYSGLLSAAYTFKVRATDVAGNTGATASATFTLDTTAG